jgi:hypothetical protein
MPDQLSTLYSDPLEGSYDLDDHHLMRMAGGA